MNEIYIKFEPALPCSVRGCNNMATVATVGPAAPQNLGEFSRFPAPDAVYLMMPLCRSCVEAMNRTYGDRP